VFTSNKENYKKNTEEPWRYAKGERMEEKGTVELILAPADQRKEVVSGLVGYLVFFCFLFEVISLRMYIMVDDS